MIEKIAMAGLKQDKLQKKNTNGRIKTRQTHD